MQGWTRQHLQFFSLPAVNLPDSLPKKEAVLKVMIWPRLSYSFFLCYLSFMLPREKAAENVTASEEDEQWAPAVSFFSGVEAASAVEVPEEDLVALAAEAASAPAVVAPAVAGKPQNR